MQQSADMDIKYLKGVGEKRAEQLKSLGVTSINALLHFYPRAYEDWNSIVPIIGSENLDKCCIKATVSTDPSKFRAKSGIWVFETRAFDETGTVKILIFNNKYAAAKLKAGEEYLFFGRVSLEHGGRQMMSPSIELPEGRNRIRPIYKATQGLSSKYIETCMERALQMYSANLEDPLPIKVREKYGLLSLPEALGEIHFPSCTERMYEARNRFIFEELLELQLGLYKIKDRRKRATGITITNDVSEKFYETLPFEPTGAQRRAVREALDDMKSESQMNRLLQGDVGSGKTMVAATLAYVCSENGYQSAIMAPTEILAEQHYATMKKFFEGTDVTLGLLTGSTSASQRREIKEDLKQGKIKFIIGTHALIQDDVEFENLGLVITDEQHRFGVGQRGSLANKGDNAHVLVMSATPIPRTLALSIYGDLDVSIIDELPKGRIPIETYRIDSSIRSRAYNYIKKHLDEGRQGYIVCPLVDESEDEGLLSATEYYEKISKNEFRDYKVGLIHGQMKAAEKNGVMEDFLKGEIQLLVSTVVIEVGVDVPNAVIMLIENAERFGLSQLHQLRGRVGRGKYKSTCILLSDKESEQTIERLSVMCNTSDGFKIAQSDLKLRGPGDFFGARQHGLPALKIADMLDNMDVLNSAGICAKEILEEDPDLKMPENALLKREINNLFSNNRTAS